MRREIRVATVLLPLVLIAGCAQKPIDPSSGHIRGDEKTAEGQIPPPVQMTPLLPKPKPSAEHRFAAQVKAHRTGQDDSQSSH